LSLLACEACRDDDSQVEAASAGSVISIVLSESMLVDWRNLILADAISGVSEIFHQVKSMHVVLYSVENLLGI
jgi:hypothetical protein